MLELVVPLVVLTVIGIVWSIRLHLHETGDADFHSDFGVELEVMSAARGASHPGQGDLWFTENIKWWPQGVLWYDSER